jgi:hypothetical protein
MGLSEEFFFWGGGEPNSNALSGLKRSMNCLDQLRKYKLFQGKKITVPLSWLCSCAVEFIGVRGFVVNCCTIQVTRTHMNLTLVAVSTHSVTLRTVTC